MEDLRVWVNIVENSRFKVRNQLNVLLPPGTEMRGWYDALVANQTLDEKEWSRKLPELGVSEAELAALKDRLIDAVLFMEAENQGSEDRQKAYVDCIKKWVVSTVLFSQNHRQLGIHLLEELLQDAMRFEFTRMTINVLQVLQLHLCSHEGRQWNHRQISSQLRRWEAVRRMEDEAVNAYTSTMVALATTKSAKREEADSVRTTYVKINNFLSKSNSCRLHLYGRLLNIAIHDTMNEYEKVIRLCKEAITFFDRKPYRYSTVTQAFHYSLLLSYLNLGAYAQCRQVVNKYRDILVAGSHNWFKWQELYLLAELHAGRYPQAAAIWQEVNARPEYANLPDTPTRFWETTEAYLNFLVDCGRLDAKKWKIRSGNTSLPAVRTEKNGLNIAVLVIQYLSALANNDEQRCWALRETGSRFRLNVRETPRSHYFLQLLALLPQTSAPEAPRKMRTLLKKLEEIPLKAGHQDFEVEILPYEILWSLVQDAARRQVQTKLPVHTV